MMLAYEFGAVAVLNRSGNDNIPEKIPQPRLHPQIAHENHSITVVECRREW